MNNGGQGTFVSWTDVRDLSTAMNIYMQYVDSTGATRWDTNGVPVCTFEADQYGPALAGDRAGGAIVCWSDYRNAPSLGSMLSAWTARALSSGKKTVSW